MILKHEWLGVGKREKKRKKTLGEGNKIDEER
jgi:hypothetical protein